MKDYKWIFFDADDTLFHFDAFQGLQKTFADFGLSFTEQDYEAYQPVNKALWTAYQHGQINAQQLQEERFAQWAQQLETSAQVINSAFMRTMVDICTPLQGAISLLNMLQGNAKLGIITNGFTELQQARLERLGLRHHFDILVISEQVGIAKPHPGIFEHAFSYIKEEHRDHILMVGDNPHSDILGGLNVGVDTCWLNVDKRATPEGIIPHYQVSSLTELEMMLSGDSRTTIKPCSSSPQPLIQK